MGRHSRKIHRTCIQDALESGTTSMAKYGPSRSRTSRSKRLPTLPIQYDFQTVRTKMTISNITCAAHTIASSTSKYHRQSWKVRGPLQTRRRNTYVGFYSQGEDDVRARNGGEMREYSRDLVNIANEPRITRSGRIKEEGPLVSSGYVRRVNHVPWATKRTMLKPRTPAMTAERVAIIQRLFS